MSEHICHTEECPAAGSHVPPARTGDRRGVDSRVPEGGEGRLGSAVRDVRRPVTDTTVYLAARYSRAEEMQGVRSVLEEMGCKVTSRWIDYHGGRYPGSFKPEQLNEDPGHCGRVAQDDVGDLVAADIVISFSSGDGAAGKGGRHVEFGMAAALGKRLILVGPREHVFHTLPEVEHYPDWPRLVMAFAPAM